MKIRAVVKHPGCAARILSVDASLEGLQEVVGGDLGRVGLSSFGGGPGIGFYCDENGRLAGREPNFLCPGQGYILGPVVVTRIDESGDEADLTDEEARGWASWFDGTG